MRALVVEDEPEVADLLSRVLRGAGWAVDVVGRGADALERLPVSDFDVAVLDIGLPDIDGLELCRRWRTQGGKTPILMLTAHGGIEDRVRGLDAGADDYLPKPFAAEELLARLRALIRRPPGALDVTLRVSDLAFDTARQEAERNGTPITLTARERALLEFLMRRQGRVVTRGQILDNVWDDNFDPVANVVDVLVARLRRRIALPGSPRLIHTIRGAGYMLSERVPADAS